MVSLWHLACLQLVCLFYRTWPVFVFLFFFIFAFFLPFCFSFLGCMKHTFWYSSVIDFKDSLPCTWFFSILFWVTLSWLFLVEFLLIEKYVMQSIKRSKIKPLKSSAFVKIIIKKIFKGTQLLLKFDMVLIPCHPCLFQSTVGYFRVILWCLRSN